jgi:hypothetical protein
MLQYYNGKYVKALVELFPGLNLNPAKFTEIPRKREKIREKKRERRERERREREKGEGVFERETFIIMIGIESHWKNEKNRRDLFCEIARERGFDPLVANNWYPISYSSLWNFKVMLYFLIVIYILFVLFNKIS